MYVFSGITTRSGLKSYSWIAVLEKSLRMLSAAEASFAQITGFSQVRDAWNAARHTSVNNRDNDGRLWRMSAAPG